MTEKNGFYKCSICGNLVSVIEAHDGTLVCCGKDMDILAEKTKDEGMEKHVPIVSIESDKLVVNIGSIDHPMEDEHYIELIQVLDGEKVIAEKRLYPGQKPHAEFYIPVSDNLKVREVCNLHGLWSNK